MMSFHRIHSGEIMKTPRTIVLLGVTGALWALVAFAQQPTHEPATNVSPYRHGNIARAQELSRQAFDALTRAQQANEFDLGGHAGRAKELLMQANDEMKMAAEAANHR
jgi:hypothetical protein